MAKETLWKQLMKGGYRTVATPKSLAISLKYGRKKGYYFINGFSIPYTVKGEDESIWIVHTEKIGRGGATAGGIYYVSKKNPNRSVWD